MNNKNKKRACIDEETRYEPVIEYSLRIDTVEVAYLTTAGVQVAKEVKKNNPSPNCNALDT